MKRVSKRIANIVYITFMIIAVLILCSSVYYSMNYSLNMVIGDSMYPTLINDDLLLIKKIKADKLTDKDIVVVNVSDVECFLDEAEENGGELYIIKRYIASKSTEDAMYLLGDNADNSADSREIGLVQKESLYGKVVMNITQEQPKTAEIIIEINQKLPWNKATN